MRRESKRNKIIIFILAGIVCLMGIGYAAFSTKLNITGTSKISSDWNIKIISANVKDKSEKAENVKNTYSELTADLEANLYNPGDYVEYDIVIENAGSFDAKLETLGITNSNNEAVLITSTGFTKGETLYKNTSKTLKVKIEYNENYEGDASGTSGESTVNLGFTQNSEGTIVPTVDHLVTYDYTTNGGESTTAENAYIAEGEQIDLSYTASKENYEFLGWNTNPQASEGLTSLNMGTSDITLYAIFKALDETPPVIENVSTTSTTNSITVVVTASEDISSIEKYAFKIDSGEYIDTGMNNSYTFTGLSQDTEHDISVKVTNNVGLQSESTKKVNTIALNVPTFSEEDLIGETTGPTEVSTSTSGTYAWTETNGVWKSGNYNVHSSTSTLTFSFTLEDTQTISFDWSVSSESASYDYLYYTIYKNGSTVSGTGTSTKIGGTSYGTNEATLTYKHVTKSLDAGTYEVTFTYRKDSSQHSGLDRGYVKNFDAGTSTVIGPIGKTVTINYPEGEGLTYEYKKDSGEWTTATQNQKVEFTESGTLVARVSDGINTESASYSAVIPKTMEEFIDTLPLVTNGDGLYKDSYEENVYTYRGANPNNYVTFNGEQWRIISVNTSDNTIKIMRNAVLSDRQFDTTNGRYQGSSGYCNNSSYGCNIWGSTSTLYDTNLSPITTLGREYNGTKYTLPTAEAPLNTYLNGEYYNGLNATAKSMVKEDAVYKVGVLYNNNTSMSQDMEQVNAAKWKGKVGLIDATEYVRASTNSSCTGVYAYSYSSSCYNNSSSHNWVYLNDIWWTLSPYSLSGSTLVWYVTSSGAFNSYTAYSSYGVRPVLTLKSNIQITGGTGTSSSPYTLGV